MGFIINPYQVQPSSAYGTLTTAWIAATGETDTTILSALNTLESDLSTYGLTSKIKALYPFVGGTATKHKYNFMDARDLDAAFRLVFNGGITHSSNGITGNGTNAYANTFFNVLTYLNKNNSHLSIYVRNNSNLGSPYDMGCCDFPLMNINPTYLISRYSSNTAYFGIADDTYGTNASSTDSIGFWCGSKNGSTTQKLFKNSSIYATGTSSGDLSNKELFICAANADGASFYTDKNYALASIGDGLTDTEAANFYTAVQTFQTTLGRQVGVPIVSDSDAQAFLNAAVITDTTQATAVNNLVIGLKADGIWNEAIALYPFVGGTATTHKWNLKDPRDLDAAYRLVFNGGVVHSSNGVQGNGTNAYYDTKFNPSVQLTSSTGGSAFIYVFNDILDAGVDLAGYQTGVNTRFQVMSRYAGSFYASMLATNLYTASNSNAIGFYGGTREPSNTTTFYAVKDANSYSYSDSYANPNCIVMGLAAGVDTSGVSFYTNRGQSFSWIGKGLTTAQSQLLRSRVLTFNSTLGR